MCVYMTSHRMRVSRQGSSVGQSMRFIPAVSRVQISPLLPESRTPEAHRAPGVFCCPRLSLSPPKPALPISKRSRAQGHPGPGQTGDFHSVPSPAGGGGNSSPQSLSGFSSPAACVRIPFLYKGSSVRRPRRPETQDTDLSGARPWTAGIPSRDVKHQTGTGCSGSPQRRKP